MLPYCWNDQTPLSNHELRMDDDVYKMRQDPAVTVGLRLETGELALVWTTTPWTLPANLGIMVAPRHRLRRRRVGRHRHDASATSSARHVSRPTPRTSSAPTSTRRSLDDRIVERLTGADLLGRSFTPPFSYYAGHERAHRVFPAEFVTTEDGTGLVHTAGAFGEEDKIVTDAAGIEPVVPVGPDGRFTWPVTDYEGMHVFDSNAHIIDHLKASTRGEGDTGSVTAGTVLLRRETYDHSYPHCWRCREPLIYMAVSSWFVEVTKIKERMLELNQEIEWTPSHIRDGQFGKWLANARDWSISRNRFWGSPIPVWKSDDPHYPRLDVYGSFEELERDFGVEVTDLHRPFIDSLTRPNPDDPTGRSTMRRVEEVFDVWFDSGSMSFAQVHYPFENAEWFEHHFPGDFIVEYIGQTRGWFYTLHVLATALFDRPAFKTCVSHGIVLGSDGQKMSKSLRNYPDVSEVFDRDGADAMRWFLMSSPILRGGNLVVTEQGIRDGVRQVMIPLWNAWSFFALYANTARGGEGYEAKRSTTSTDVLDRYLLAKLSEFVGDMRDQLDDYEIAAACDTMRGFLDVLTNWYIRRSRDRFWGGESEESLAAFDTLWTALETVTRATAPLLPLVTEEIWRGLTGGRSVHLTDFPDPADLPADHALVVAMDRAREICSTGSSLRKAQKLRARLPLGDLTLVVPQPDGPGALPRHHPGRAQRQAPHPRRPRDRERGGLRHHPAPHRQRPGGRAATGPRGAAGHQGQQVGRLVGRRRRRRDLRRARPRRGRVHPRDGRGRRRRRQPRHGDAPGGGFVVLDTTVTPELAAEGVARDLVRAVQQARRDAGLHVSDRISLTIQGSPEVFEATVTHRDLIVGETLATQFASGPTSTNGSTPADTRARRSRRRRRRRQPARNDPGGEAMTAPRPSDDSLGAGAPGDGAAGAHGGVEQDDLEIRLADGDDLSGVLSVGHRTWPATYEPIAGPEYVAMGLAKWWTPDVVTTSIRQGRTLVAVDGAEVVGVATFGVQDGEPSPSGSSTSCPATTAAASGHDCSTPSSTGRSSSASTASSCRTSRATGRRPRFYARARLHRDPP